MDDVGGLVGFNDTSGTISNSYNIGAVTGILIGGIVADNEGQITDVFDSSWLNGMNFGEGGIAFTNNGTISNSFFDENVSGSSVAVAPNGTQGSCQNNVTGGSFGS